MVRRLGNWSRLEVRAMIRFLWAKNVYECDIRCQIVKVYDEKAMNRQHIAKWCHSFESGRQDVENRNMVRKSRSSSPTTKINTVRIEEMIQNDCEISSV
ncbi:histone-lysine N-methyltransferase SETMAR [Trichonephila clavipes]|nr:histone-lysine N-methyltransferase SETMAR [Trichonephila clavipes]